MNQRRLHAVLTIAWAALVIPTLLWWRESILWVAFMSLYANVVGHWGAYQAARTEKSDDDSDEGTEDEDVGRMQESNAELTWEIRELLVAERLRRGLTQLEVAQGAGFASQSHLSALENGTWAPGWDVLSRWVEALGVHLHIHISAGVVTARLLREENGKR